SPGVVGEVQQHRHLVPVAAALDERGLRVLYQSHPPQTAVRVIIVAQLALLHHGICLEEELEVHQLRKSWRPLTAPRIHLVKLPHIA
ncbi:hypothetical protein DRN98_07755, partial [Methanosarcinales archaeon]